MFCTNCGNQMQEDAGFCTNCGTPRQAANTAGAAAYQPAYQTAPVRQGAASGTKGVCFWLSMASIVISIIGLLSAWLSVPAIRTAYSLFGNTGGKSTYTIFEVFQFIDKLDRYVDSSDTGIWMFFAVVFIILAVAVIAALVWYAYKLIADYKNSGKRGKRAFFGAVLLPILFAIIVISLNGYVEEQSRGFINGVIDIAGGVYCTFITGMIGLLLSFKMHKDNKANLEA